MNVILVVVPDIKITHFSISFSKIHIQSPLSIIITYKSLNFTTHPFIFNSIYIFPPAHKIGIVLGGGCVAGASTLDPWLCPHSEYM